MWDLQALRVAGVLSDLDLQFAELMVRLAGSDSPVLLWTAALLSGLRQQGHSCLDLARLAGRVIPFEGDDLPCCPPLADWLAGLQSVSVIGQAGEYKPLILQDQRLYLYRYWDYESRLIHWFKQRALQRVELADEAQLKAGIHRLFPSQSLDWQKLAALMALLKPFCVISGGPGTGKTTTVAKILVLLLEQPTVQPLRIALAAPTGKAAARLQESIAAAKNKLACRQAIKDLIPDDSYTLHRLLGVLPHSPYFRHHAQNPLPVDVVIVDEASMVDLALLTKLVEAIPPWARLILLGDKDQLASVEVGAVLGDLCQHEVVESYSDGFMQRLSQFSLQIPTMALSLGNAAGIQDHVVLLQKSYRFRGDSGIGQLAQRIKQGDGAGALWLMKNASYADIVWHELNQTVLSLDQLQPYIIQGFGHYLKIADPLQVLQRFNQFRVLVVHRQGPHGVHRINQLIEIILEQAQVIRRQGQWYHGQPIMITRNDYPLRLYNGDIGVILYDETQHRLSAWFQTANPQHPVRSVPLVRLPEHQTVYAMTVHKSQGSEFDTMVLILPENVSPILSKELIYTGITRARKAAVILGHPAVFQQAVAQSLWRMSGIPAKLWQE